MRSWTPPQWARDTGRWSWIIVGVILVLAAAFYIAASTYVLMMAALFAALFAGTFLPVVDRLARHRVPRWAGGILVAALLVALAVAIAFLVVGSVVNQVPEIAKALDSAQQRIREALDATSMPAGAADAVRSAIQKLAKNVASGAAGALVGVVQGVATLIFGVFIALNILVWLLIQGRDIARWASRHAGPVPPPVAYEILANSMRFFRGYIWGSTLVGLYNGGVMAIGALIIGVPLAAAIGVVGWFTNYVPYFGAIISGIFAVLIALGSGGPAKAIPMLIVVIVSNGYLQTVVSQFALGKTLRLHPLAVLFATTASGLLAGALGGVFAAPFLKIAVDANRRLRAAGVFGDTEAAGEDRNPDMARDQSLATDRASPVVKDTSG